MCFRHTVNYYCLCSREKSQNTIKCNPLLEKRRKCPGLELTSILLAVGQSLELLTNKCVHSSILFYIPHVENVRSGWEGRLEDGNVLHGWVVMSELLTVHRLQLLAPTLSQALFPQLSHYCPINRALCTCCSSPRCSTILWPWCAWPSHLSEF